MTNEKEIDLDDVDPILEADDVVVELEGEDSDNKSEIVIEKTEPPVKKAEIPVEAGIQELKRKLEEEKQARIAAENKIRQSDSELYKARNEVDDTNLKLIDNALETVKRNELLLKQKLKEAYASQDVDQIFDIQSEISVSANQKIQLEQGRVAYERRMKEGPKVAPVSDPVEALASQLTPRSAQWVRSHPEYATNPNLYQKMIAAHQLAIADGLQSDTDDYFESVETTLRIRKPQPEYKEEPMSSAPTPSPKRTSPPAAPVSRAATDNSGNRPNRVSLSREEQEIAQMMGMTNKEYAANKIHLQKAGKI